MLTSTCKSMNLKSTQLPMDISIQNLTEINQCGNSDIYKFLQRANDVGSVKRNVCSFIPLNQNIFLYLVGVENNYLDD